MLFFLSFDIGYVLILNEYLGMVVCCDLVSSPQLKMSTDRTETGSWQLLNTYLFVTSKTKKWCNLIKLIIFVGTYSVSRKWNDRISWDR